MSFARYALLVLAIVGGSLGLLWPLVLRGLEPRARWAACAGSALAAFNTLVAYALVVWSQSRSTTVFFRAVLGGMVGRLGVMLAAVVAGILLLGLPKLPLTLSLLSYFVLFLVLELTQAHRRTSVQPEAR